MLNEVYKTGIWTNTYSEGVNKGSRSQRHTAAQQGKDGVAQVIWKWIGQWSEHFSRRLHSDHILHRIWPWSVHASCRWSSILLGTAGKVVRGRGSSFGVLRRVPLQWKQRLPCFWILRWIPLCWRLSWIHVSLDCSSPFCSSEQCLSLVSVD